VVTLEPIGRTGDALTGITAALIFKGYPVGEAATLAAKANRLAGELVNSTPATQVFEIVKRLPEALESVLGQCDKASSG